MALPIWDWFGYVWQNGVATPVTATYYGEAYSGMLGGINNTGQLAVELAPQRWETLGLWDRNGATVTGVVSGAYGINDSGTVIGWRAYGGDVFGPISWTKGGGFVPLNTGSAAFPEAGTPVAINNLNQVVGGVSYGSSSPHHAFLTSVSSRQDPTDLGTLGGDFSYAYGINDLGQIVGTSNTTANGSNHAFIWQSGAMTDLNALIPAGSGWTLTKATGINKYGQICGTGTTRDGTQHAFLLTPRLPLGINVDSSGGYGFLDGQALIDYAKGVSPLQATLVPQFRTSDIINGPRHLRIWLGVNGLQATGGATVQPSSAWTAPAILARHKLFSPSVDPEYVASFPSVGSSVMLSANMTMLSAELTILDIVLKTVGAPATADDIAMYLDSFEADLLQVSALTKAASHFIPLPTTPAGYLRASANAILDLTQFTPADKLIIKKIIEHASPNATPFNTDLLDSISNPLERVLALKYLLEVVSDLSVLGIQAHGNDFQVTFTEVPVK